MINVSEKTRQKSTVMYYSYRKEQSILAMQKVLKATLYFYRLIKFTVIIVSNYVNKITVKDAQIIMI